MRSLRILIALLVVVALSSGASAAPGDGIWADVTLSGSTGSYSGTVDFPGVLMPGATVASDARATSSATSGSSAWIGPNTPPGVVFGTSQGNGYLNFRPASGSAPSTTTYTFADVTPASGWGFVFGDIDADTVTVSALDANGDPVSGADLGFRGVFNYCDTSPRPSTCSGASAPYDLPTWSPTATGGSLVGSGTNQQGPAGWFMPTVPLSSLTVVMSVQLGSPTYQTWFASTDLALAGTVSTDGTIPAGGIEISLGHPAGGVLATTTTDTDGTYSFSGLLDGVEYVVMPAPPPGYVVGPTQTSVTPVNADLSGIDFTLLDEPPAPTSTSVPPTSVPPPPSPSQPPSPSAGAANGAPGAPLAIAG
ncbi:MAG: SdrD B-like domain-containing protein [Microthrixaceae bacterium]